VPVMLPSSRVASTKPEAALVRSQGWEPWLRDRGPDAGKYCSRGH
jgi:hypothetical protein